MEQPTKCAYCGAEMRLYVGDIPICIKCEAERENKGKGERFSRPRPASSERRFHAAETSARH